MFRSNLVIALRNFRKRGTATVINLVGLTVGMTSCLLIALYILHEAGYDRFEKNGDRIARVIMRYQFPGSAPDEGNFTSVKVASAFQHNFPEVESTVKMESRERVVAFGEKRFDEKSFLYADSTFFRIFSFRLVAGDPVHALDGPDQVVLSESTARKYFGSGDAVGKTLLVGATGTPFTVTGVAEDCPSNSQIQFGLVASFSSLKIPPEWWESYWDANFVTYVLLRSPGARETLQAKLGPFMDQEMKGQGARVRYTLEPMLRIHLHSPYDAFVPNQSVSYLFILGAVALLILVIACFTFINLSTARSLERAREVGVRKVLGAGKGQLFRQFIGESALFCAISLVLSWAAVLLLVPGFGTLTGVTFGPAEALSWPLPAISALIGALVSLLAGAYPALILAGFRPVRVLKGAFKNSGPGQWLRQSLIVFQLSISVFLIAATWVVREQLRYLQRKDLGYDRSHVLVLGLDSKLDDKLDLVKSELTADPDVLSAAASYSSPADIGGGYTMRTAAMPEKDALAVTGNPVDEDYLRTMGVRLVAGSDLSKQDVKDAAKDSGAVYHFLLNESAARRLGWTPRTAVGQRMYLGDNRPGIVKGVVKDFHFASLRQPIAPLVLFPDVYLSNLLVKVSGRRMPETLSYIQSKWKELAPYQPFTYRFLDDDYNALYASEMRLGRMMDVFAAVAVLLACLGLFGLSSYAAQQRVREIGIRKVLGASVTGIAVLLSRRFVRLSAIAILIALPVAGWVMSDWLGGFAYRARLDWTVFAGSGFLTVFLTLLTVSFKAIQAARIKPVKNLRTE